MQMGLRVGAEAMKQRSDSATAVASTKYACCSKLVIIVITVRPLQPMLEWGLTSHGNLATAKTHSV